MKLFTGVFLFLFSTLSYSQEKKDSLQSRNLEEVAVKAFAADRPLIEVAAPIHIIGPKELDRFENTDLLNSINQYPGIRMEERSPGSYRLSIRGSSVRSPFGVRNVKVYWNDIPLTDANGITYFNQMDMNTFQGIEILRGPSASIYGAGIGGVLLLDTKAGNVKNQKTSSLAVNSLFGSYNTQNRSVTFKSASKKINTLLNYSHAGTGGYRDHSAMRRDVVNWRSSFFLNDKFTTHLFSYYGDLVYQTPGGLNLDQKNENRRWARQATKFTPSSEEQKAAIYQKQFSFGITQEMHLSSTFTSKISVWGTKADLKNPFITNYEIRDQKSIGIRNSNSWQITQNTKFVTGFEIQQTNSDFEVYDNDGGKTAAVQFKETVNANQSSIFGQLDFTLPMETFLTAGLSINNQNYDYRREAGIEVKESSKVPVMPRISLLKKLSKGLSAFGSISGGYSPPTVQELVTIYEDPAANLSPLEAETGTNYELGLKGQKSLFYYEIVVYRLDMNNAIVRAINSIEREYFRNAGKAKQSGLEILGKYQKSLGQKLHLDALVSADLKNYEYIEFSDGEDIFNGNKIPSVPNQTFTIGLDLAHVSGLYFHNNLNVVGDIPLNDENTVYADSYSLYNARLGWKKAFNSFIINVYTGGNNLLNTDYSLGNDINAFGNRFYNPAATRNWNGGFSLELRF
ncbi:MAG: TonB-dependent receptor [Cytophagales bacterium]|nr:TonB-dependent receptor [Cytophagales bacterium]